MKAKLYDMEKVSHNVRNMFEVGDYVIFGYQVHIDRVVNGFYYTQNNGKDAYMSARYYGYIIDPDGTRVELNTKAKARGGWIARHCGLWVTKEKRDMREFKKLYEVTNRNIIED